MDAKVCDNDAGGPKAKRTAAAAAVNDDTSTAGAPTLVRGRQVDGMYSDRQAKTNT